MLFLRCILFSSGVLILLRLMRRGRTPLWITGHRSPVADAFARKKEVESAASVPRIWMIFLGAVDQTKSVSVVTP
jgi:hypothetical protein